jgi:hypothetical protein
MKDRRQVEVTDESPMESGDIPLIAMVGMNIQDHGEPVSMFSGKI